jgi:hypothetical protein
MAGSLQLVCVDPARIREVWPLVKDRARIAIERTELSDFDQYEADVLAGHHLVWLAWDGQNIAAVATTHKTKIGEKTICTLTACQGYDRDRWLPLFQTIEKYAKDEGCAAMRLFGRKGWERVLDGYKVEHVVMEKVL